MKNKLKKKYDAVKLLPIEEDLMSYKNKFIEVYKIQFDEINKIIESIADTGDYKFLLNFEKDLYYLFKYSNEIEIAYG